MTLDLREPSRLPTLGSRHFDEKLRAVETDGRFVYLRTRATEGDAEEDGAGAWRTFRATAASALDPAERAPARAFAKKRQYAGRWAARLTGAALHLALRAEAP